MKAPMSTRAASTLGGVMVVAAFVAGCAASDDAAERNVGTTSSALIEPVGTGDPVTVRNWDWNGSASDLTLADGNVTDPPGSYTITYAVTPAAVGHERTLSVTREEASGKLRVVTQDFTNVWGGRKLLVSRSTLDVIAHGGMTMTRWSQGQNTITCLNGDLGPFVLDSPVCYEPLFDQRTLSKLPVPLYFNGTLTKGNLALGLAAVGAYKKVYTDHLLLWDTFRYRANVASRAVAGDVIYNAIQAFLVDTELASHHHDIDHTTPLGDKNEDWTDLGHHAGFLDGHRAYIFEAEAWLTSPQNFPHVVPFRRLPVWIPTTVPVGFDQDSLPNKSGTDVDTTTGGPGVRAGDRHATICRTYNTAGTPRLEAMQKGGSSINGWHGGVHGHFGGHFEDFSVTANTSLFWVWHTTVDSVWANLQRCYLDDGDSLKF